MALKMELKPKQKVVATFLNQFKKKSFEACFEETLTTTLNAALMKEPPNRSDFDGKVFESFEEVTAAKITAKSTIMAEQTAASAELNAVVVAAKTALDEKQEVSKICSDAKVEPLANRKQCEQAVKDAKNILKDTKPHIVEAAAVTKEAEGVLADFKEHTMEVFVGLRDRHPVVEEVAEPEEKVDDVVLEGAETTKDADPVADTEMAAAETTDVADVADVA